MNVELRQQVGTDVRRQPLDIDRVYVDGRAVGLIGRSGTPVLQTFRRMASIEVQAIVDEINKLREPDNQVVTVAQPQDLSKLKAKLKQAEGGDE